MSAKRRQDSKSVHLNRLTIIITRLVRIKSENAGEPNELVMAVNQPVSIGRVVRVVGLSDIIVVNWDVGPDEVLDLEGLG